MDILTAFGGLLLATVLVVIFYFYRNTTRVVLMLCGDLMEQTTQAVISRTTSFLEPVDAMTDMSSKLASAGVLAFRNPAGLEHYAIEVLQAYPRISTFQFGDQAGNFLLSNRQPDGITATKLINRRGLNPPLTTWKYWDKNFQVIKTKTSSSDTFDPRLRPWYQGAQEKRGLYVTDLFIFYITQKPGICVSYPVLDPEGRVMGVIGSDIELTGLSTFLKSLRIGEHGLALIINEKKELVAFPDATRIINSQMGDGVLHTVHVWDLGISSISAAFHENQTSGAARVAVETGGQKYLATFRDFSPCLGKNWKVIVVVPEDDFIGAVKRINQGVFLICLAILGVASLMVLLFSRSISKPILLLATETDRIRNFQLDEKFQIQSHIFEIQLLQQAVDRMKATLRSFTRFAPEQIVREVVVRGQETLLGGERREVTLLFSDLRNFTHFSEQTRPEEVVQILNTHFDTMVKIITQHQGFVVDFLGDSLFAVFGAPDRDPEHGRRAVACAIDMQLARQEMNRAHEGENLPLMEMGIGINTGLCVVGNMGSLMRIKYGVVGHAVNLASRLESFTMGGQVLISESTYQAVAPQFELAGPLSAYAKGVEGAIRLWEVRGVAQQKDKSLPHTVPGLIRLAAPLSVLVRLITGKQVSAAPYQGRLVQLSSTGAELETELPLEIFDALQIEISSPAEPGLLIDTKVVGVGEPGDSYIIKFSGLSEAAAAAVNLWLRDES
ncbi:MAG: adenylate/guanylate cyclase domain-containing protein [Desulfobaccales bacterium]